MKHIAEIDYKEFFKEYFQNELEYDEFNKKLVTNEIALKMFHQTARIISIADKLGDYIAYRPAINLLFYIMTSELIAKLYFNYKEEGKPKEFVKKFFNNFCNDYNKEIIKKSIRKNDVLLNFDEVIDFFYKIRCDVVHEGNYYKYSFSENDIGENMSNALLPNYKINIRIEDIRKILIESAINAIRMKVEIII